MGSTETTHPAGHDDIEADETVVNEAEAGDETEDDEEEDEDEASA